MLKTIGGQEEMLELGGAERLVDFADTLVDDPAHITSNNVRLVLHHPKINYGISQSILPRSSDQHLRIRERMESSLSFTLTRANQSVPRAPLTYSLRTDLYELLLPILSCRLVVRSCVIGSAQLHFLLVSLTGVFPRANQVASNPRRLATSSMVGHLAFQMNLRRKANLRSPAANCHR